MVLLEDHAGKLCPFVNQVENTVPLSGMSCCHVSCMKLPVVSLWQSLYCILTISSWCS